MALSPTMLLLFHILVAGHIATGATGAITFWVPILGRKGGAEHRKWGRIFTGCMLATGTLAIGMSILTLIDPMETHPHLESMFDAVFIRAIFGWLMLHMGILTVNLAWYGWLCVLNRRDHLANRTPFNLGLQAAVILAAINCAAQGVLAGQYLMCGLAIVGITTGITNLVFILGPRPAPLVWQKEHLKGLVGCGISVYTAFFAFGSVRILPELALHPVMWAIPLTTGVLMILYHWRQIGLLRRRAA